MVRYVFQLNGKKFKMQHLNELLLAPSKRLVHTLVLDILHRIKSLDWIVEKKRVKR